VEKLTDFMVVEKINKVGNEVGSPNAKVVEIVFTFWAPHCRALVPISEPPRVILWGCGLAGSRIGGLGDGMDVPKRYYCSSCYCCSCYSGLKDPSNDFWLSSL
jgi:hypothetical protein